MNYGTNHACSSFRLPLYRFPPASFREECPISAIFRLRFYEMGHLRHSLPCPILAIFRLEAAGNGTIGTHRTLSHLPLSRLKSAK